MTGSDGVSFLLPQDFFSQQRLEKGEKIFNYKQLSWGKLMLQAEHVRAFQKLEVRDAAFFSMIVLSKKYTHFISKLFRGIAVVASYSFGGKPGCVYSK